VTKHLGKRSRARGKRKWRVLRLRRTTRVRVGREMRHVSRYVVEPLGRAYRREILPGTALPCPNGTIGAIFDGCVWAWVVRICLV